MNKKWMVLLVVTAVLLLAGTGCISRMEIGSTETETQTIERNDASSARVNIQMGIGKLDVRGGANDLMDAEFTYNVPAWKPEVDYEVRGGEGRLTVKQPDAEVKTLNIPEDDIEYEWSLQLNDNVPMDLNIDLGVGESYLELGSLSLTNLDINMGVGETTVDLTGDWEQSVDINIEGGIGATTVRLPNDVGVRVETQTGIGSINVHGLIANGDTYTNAAYETADVVLDITVNGGIGEITLRLEE